MKKRKKKAASKRWKTKEVGTYWFAQDRVRIVVDSSLSDEAYAATPADEDPRCVITLGVKCHWNDVVGALLHELFELGLMRRYMVYDPINTFRSTVSDRLFVFHHSALDQVCGMVGDVAAVALPGLAKIHREVKGWDK